MRHGTRRTGWTIGIMLVLTLVVAGVASADGTLTTEFVWVEDLGTMKQVKVYLPEGYDPADTDTRYPVVVFLHGGGVTNCDYPMLIDALNTTIWTGAGDPPDGRVRPMIAVLPDGTSFDYDGMSWWADSPVHGNYQSWITGELIAWIDAEYNTRATSAQRGVFGHSMGGCGAMRAALMHSDVFRGAAAHGGVVDFTTTVNGISPWVLDENGGSGPFSPNAGVWSTVMFSMAAAFSPNLDNDPEPVDLPITDDGTVDPAVWPMWQAADPPHLARSFTATTQPAIYLQVGEDDMLWIDANQAFADSLAALGLEFRHDVHPGDHSSALAERFPHTLAFFDSLFTAGTGVNEPTDTPSPHGFELRPVYPNPWNDHARASVMLARSGALRIDLVNALGQTVATIHDGFTAAGRHPFVLNGHLLPSGTYLLRATLDGRPVGVRKTILLH